AEEGSYPTGQGPSSTHVKDLRGGSGERSRPPALQVRGSGPARSQL
ncbi:MAG: hypothetical protein AVDCRST_MAG05-4395, partial [uncultured Rubrobacteraceae bacterium]